MKNIGLILTAALIFTGCSASATQTAGTVEQTASTIETTTEAVSNETTAATQETTEAEKTVELNVYSYVGINEEQQGWFADYLNEKIGVKVSVCMDKPEEADMVYVVCSETSGLSDISKDDLIEFSDDLLDSYGDNLTKYFSAKMDSISKVLGSKCGVYSQLVYGEDDTNNLYMWGITKNCKNPEKAMELLNLLADPETTIVIANGTEGTYWQCEDGTYSAVSGADFFSSDFTAGTPLIGNMWMNSSVDPEDTEGRTFAEISSEIMGK